MYKKVPETLTFLLLMGERAYMVQHKKEKEKAKTGVKGQAITQRTLKIGTMTRGSCGS